MQYSIFSVWPSCLQIMGYLEVSLPLSLTWMLLTLAGASRILPDTQSISISCKSELNCAAPSILQKLSPETESSIRRFSAAIQPESGEST